MLDYSFRSYGQDYINTVEKNFLLNPMAIPNEILKHFPPT